MVGCVVSADAMTMAVPPLMFARFTVGQLFRHAVSSQASLSLLICRGSLSASLCHVMLSGVASLVPYLSYFMYGTPRFMTPPLPLLPF